LAGTVGRLDSSGTVIRPAWSGTVFNGIEAADLSRDF
jgi:hypothetical protein